MWWCGLPSWRVSRGWAATRPAPSCSSCWHSSPSPRGSAGETSRQPGHAIIIFLRVLYYYFVDIVLAKNIFSNFENIFTNNSKLNLVCRIRQREVSSESDGAGAEEEAVSAKPPPAGSQFSEVLACVPLSKPVEKILIR